MCHKSCLEFGERYLFHDEIKNKRVLEIGSQNVNGSLRPFIESMTPLEYIGIDVMKGKGVDKILGVEQIVEVFDENSFDLVIATELLEHVFDWKIAVLNIKKVCKPNGIILVTTRSPGFAYHGYPKNNFPDYWRFTLEDIQYIFFDCNILALIDDRQHPGVFLKEEKISNFLHINLADYTVFAMEQLNKGKQL